MQQRNVEDAVLEAQKPLARHIDDEDLDKLLREQERDGDPMAGLLRKKKEKEGQKKGVKGLRHSTYFMMPCFRSPAKILHTTHKIYIRCLLF